MKPIFVVGHSNKRRRNRIRQFDRFAPAIYVKGGLSMYFLYVAALAIRVVINFLFVGSERFYFNKEQTILGNENATAIMPFLHTNPAMRTLVSKVADFLLIIAVGLIIGRNARVLRYYCQQKHEKMAS